MLIFYAAVAIYWIATGYLQSDLTFIAGLGVLFLSTVVRQPGVGSWRFAIWAALCVGLGLAIPARTFHFLALVFAAGFVFENWKGKINEAPVLTALLLTAVVKTMSIVLGFAIRLELSKNAAAALRYLGMDAVAEGNMIRLKDQYFSVDPACMGLQMVEVSFLFCFFLLGLFERRSGRYLPWTVLLAAVAGVGLLNLIFNQLRIIFLVVFNILPENPMHDAVGLVGLALYVFVPTWLGLRWAFGRSGSGRALLPELSQQAQGAYIFVETPKNILPGPAGRYLFAGDTGPLGRVLNQIRRFYKDIGPLGLLRQPRTYIPVVHILLSLGIGWFVFNESAQATSHVTDTAAIVPKGLPANAAINRLQDGVIQYKHDSLLVYVKPIRGFYSTEHTPLICWQGSGYTFGKIWEQKIGNILCYAGTLEKPGGPVLYTAWWFDNGQEQTISQARWRWLDAGGAPGFSLVNVTASDKQTLERQLDRMVYGL